MSVNSAAVTSLVAFALSLAPHRAPAQPQVGATELAQAKTLLEVSRAELTAEQFGLLSRRLAAAEAAYAELTAVARASQAVVAAAEGGAAAASARTAATTGGRALLSGAAELLPLLLLLWPATAHAPGVERETPEVRAGCGNTGARAGKAAAEKERLLLHLRQSEGSDHRAETDRPYARGRVSFQLRLGPSFPGRSVRVPMRRRRGPPSRPIHRGDAAPTQIWAGSAPPERILYFSTMARFRWWLSLSRTDYEAPQRIAAVAHGGLPTHRDLELLRTLREPRGAPVTIFGDLDPDDLLVYASLSAGLDTSSGRPKRQAVDYSGVTSRLLALVARTIGESAIDQATRPFDRREAALMRFIRAKSLVDLERVLGASAAAILDGGHKIEIEAIVPPLLSHQTARKTLMKWLRTEA